MSTLVGGYRVVISLLTKAQDRPVPVHLLHALSSPPHAVYAA
ncbi:hypothetical protein [Brucella oryzae]|nr:hypothetical protein [Brucella oryzae]